MLSGVYIRKLFNAPCMRKAMELKFVPGEMGRGWSGMRPGVSFPDVCERMGSLIYRVD